MLVRYGSIEKIRTLPEPSYGPLYLTQTQPSLVLACLNEQRKALIRPDSDSAVSSLSPGSAFYSGEHVDGFSTRSNVSSYGGLEAASGVGEVAKSVLDDGAEGEAVGCGVKTGLRDIFASGRDVLSGADATPPDAGGSKRDAAAPIQLFGEGGGPLESSFPLQTKKTKKRVRFAPTVDFQVGVL